IGWFANWARVGTVVSQRGGLGPGGGRGDPKTGPFRRVVGPRGRGFGSVLPPGGPPGPPPFVGVSFSGGDAFFVGRASPPLSPPPPTRPIPPPAPSAAPPPPLYTKTRRNRRSRFPSSFSPPPWQSRQYVLKIGRTSRSNVGASAARSGLCTSTAPISRAFNRR